MCTQTYVQISYLNAIEGGSGQTRIALDELPIWLSNRPGTLVREVRDLDIRRKSAAQAILEKDAARWRFVQAHHLQYFIDTKVWWLLSETGETLFEGSADTYAQAVDCAIMAMCK